MIDVFFNDNSMFELGWLRESIDFPTPSSQSSSVSVPGRSDPIRYNEILGEVAYNPRTFSIVLTMSGSRKKYNDLLSNLVNEYAGKVSKVVLSEEKEFYYLGTLEFTPSYDPFTGKGEVKVSSSDADAFKYHVKETEVTFSGSGTFTLENDYMSVVPVCSFTDETTLSFKVGDEEYSKTVSAGTYTFPELELSEGENTIKIETEGDSTFKYREGRL